MRLSLQCGQTTYCSKNDFLTCSHRQSYFTKTREKHENPIAARLIDIKAITTTLLHTPHIAHKAQNVFPEIVSFRSIPFRFDFSPHFSDYCCSCYYYRCYFFRYLSIPRSTYKSKSYWIFKTFIPRIVIYLCQLCSCQIIVSHLFSERFYSWLVGGCLYTHRLRIGEKKGSEFMWLLDFTRIKCVYI